MRLLSRITLPFLGAAVASIIGAGLPGAAWPQTQAAAPTASDAIVKRIDPTDFTTRAEIRNEYQDMQNGGSMNLLVPRLDYAVSKRFSLRLETPIVTSDPNTPSNDGESGFGNLLVRGSYRAARGEGYAVVVAGELILDTASRDSLGMGKDIIAPLAFASIDLPRYRSVFFPFVQHYMTIGGDDSRPDVHYTSIKTVLLTRWPDRFYTVVEPNFIIDHERADRLGFTLEGELGRFLNRNVAVWGRPGVGLYGDNLPMVYNWNIEIGLRYIFN